MLTKEKELRYSLKVHIQLALFPLKVTFYLNTESKRFSGYISHLPSSYTMPNLNLASEPWGSGVWNPLEKGDLPSVVHVSCSECSTRFLSDRQWLARTSLCSMIHAEPGLASSSGEKDVQGGWWRDWEKNHQMLMEAVRTLPLSAHREALESKDLVLILTPWGISFNLSEAQLYPQQIEGLHKLLPPHSIIVKSEEHGIWTNSFCTDTTERTQGATNIHLSLHFSHTGYS